MRTYKLDAFVKRADGSLHSFIGEVFSPKRIKNAYVCRVITSLWKKERLVRSNWPEMAYSDACNAVRFDLEDRKLFLCNSRGQPIEFSPPLSRSGLKREVVRRVENFPLVRLSGLVKFRDGTTKPVIFSIGPARRVPKTELFSAAIKSNWIDLKQPTKSRWPDHAYSLAFYRVRLLLKNFDAEFVTGRGRPIDISAHRGGQ